MDNFTFIGNSDPVSIEALYKQYLESPESVDESWANFFKGFEFAQKMYPASPKASAPTEGYALNKEFDVINLINAYRTRGHLFTKTNPVRARRQYFPTLDISNFGLSKEDLNQEFGAGIELGLGKAKLKTIIEHLDLTYCHSLAVEYMYIRQPEIMSWLQRRMEKSKNIPTFKKGEKIEIFNHLKRAVGFEKFIHKRFVGQKRFSLEGAEALVPALDFCIEHGAAKGISEFVLGMPHRGRLNVLANTMQKPVEKIFTEFMGEEYDESISLGDVKYHLGYNKEIITPNGQNVYLSLLPNPSHLETVGALVEGMARARIDEVYGGDNSKLAPIVIHGDAAIAAQGIVYETIQMAQLEGYKTGGTIHIVINNQVGFTTNYTEARSSTYATDIAKVTRCPVFHVNGDDVEAVVYTVELALEYRQKFKTDVFIDLLCYRRYGHNEGDEPRFTQPLLYKEIAKHPNPFQIYAKQLQDQKVLSDEDVKAAEAEYEAMLDSKLELAKLSGKVKIDQFLYSTWKEYIYPSDKDHFETYLTKFDKDQLYKLALAMNTLPEGKSFFSKIVKLFDDRKKMVAEDKLDWAMGELLAYATLLSEGHPIRLSGQDSERGTFSHRHATVRIEDSEEKYYPLRNLQTPQAQFDVYNSLLSEYGVLGYEYGYALARPNTLTLWEAQFGDFHNVAQPVIDQYISSAEEKWGLKNGLVMLLPHGYEGQGPEHSSARIERFLILAAGGNMNILYPSNPANMYHALRRVMKRPYRVPTVIFTPKSLLRHAECVSSVADLADGTFHEVYDDTQTDVAEVRRLVFCTGKIYYDLLAKKRELNARDVAIIRIEQLHPFPKKQIKQIIKKYPNVLLKLWVQEEPENMGAWFYIQREMSFTELTLVARVQSGSPAVGLNKLHVIGQNELVYKVFRKCDCDLKNVYCGLQCVVGKSREEILKQHTYLLDTLKGH